MWQDPSKLIKTNDKKDHKWKNTLKVRKKETAIKNKKK